MGIALVGFLAALTVGMASAAHSKTKPLPVPKLSLDVTLSGRTVTIHGGFRANGKSLPTVLRWSEQELDLTGNPLPLTTSGYTFTTQSDGSQVAQTTATGSGRTVAQRIPGANRMQLTVVASTAASRTHKRASATRTFSIEPSNDAPAVGTTIPQRQYWGDNTKYPYFAWAKSLSTPDDSPTVHLPEPWLQPGFLGFNLSVCHWQGMPGEPPTDPLPNRDGVSASTGLTVYPIKLVCDNGYWATSSITVDFEYPANGVSGAVGDACEFTVRGITSFTLPPTWRGFISFYVNLITLTPDGSIYNADEAVQSRYAYRTHGNVNVCQIQPPLPRLHP